MGGFVGTCIISLLRMAFTNSTVHPRTFSFIKTKKKKIFFKGTGSLVNFLRSARISNKRMLLRLRLTLTQGKGACATQQRNRHNTKEGRRKRWYVFILTFLFVNSAQAKAHRSELMYTHTPRAILKKVIGADNQHILQLVKQRERRERKKATTMTLPKFESRLLLRWE